jgi:hypothetical protein
MALMMLLKWGKPMLARWSALLAIMLCLAGASAFVFAAEPASDFSLQVSPSPLVATVKPGQTENLELKVRNAGTGTEELRIDSRKFTVNRESGEVKLEDTVPSEIAQWVTFNTPTFKVKPGEWTTIKVRISIPKEAGFSYSLALVLNRTNNPTKIESGRLLQGSVAVFTLINVDKPGAVRKLDVTDFKPSQTLYEYLPAKFTVTFRNVGNTIVQPYGNVFIQRGANDTEPIATLPVNDKGGYLLPDTPRTLPMQWDQGFPVFKTTTSADGKENEDLAWDWSKLTDFRIGPYTAKLVAIYNDGQRDVPIERAVTFWVIPWRTILILTAVISILAYLRHKQIQRKTRKAVRRALEERDKKKEGSDAK